MATERKERLVQQFSEQLSDAKSVVFTDYRGLSTAQLEDLRDKIEKAGGSYSITKNTLFRLAAEEKGLPDELGKSDILQGPTATLFAKEDEVTPIKALAEFINEFEKPIIKGGLLDMKVLDYNDVKQLSELPTFDELIGQLMNVLNSPITALAMQLNAPMTNLVGTLTAIKKRGGEA